MGRGTNRARRGDGVPAKTLVAGWPAVRELVSREVRNRDLRATGMPTPRCATRRRGGESPIFSTIFIKRPQAVEATDASEAQAGISNYLNRSHDHHQRSVRFFHPVECRAKPMTSRSIPQTSQPADRGACTVQTPQTGSERCTRSSSVDMSFHTSSAPIVKRTYADQIARDIRIRR